MAKRKKHRDRPQAAPAPPTTPRAWPLGLRVFGYWALYAVVGVFIVLMILGGAGGDLGGGENNGIRDNTKVIGALSGLALGVALVALFFTDHAQLLTKLAVYGGFPAAAILTVWTWMRLDTDLSR
jgi:hypothetical protein